MSNKVIGDYTDAITIDGSTHYLLIQPGSSSTAYNKINRNVFLGVSGQPVDISTSQTLTNKVIGTTNSITGNVATFQLSGTNSRLISFALGTTNATTRTVTFPDSDITIVGAANTQTLTNKTLTSPTISGGSIDNTTITVDTISGHTTPNTGTVYGLSVTSGKLGTTALATNAVQASQLATNAIILGYAQIVSAATVASATRSDLSTSLSVTVTVPAGGRDIEIVFFSSGASTSGAAGTGNSIAIMESTTCLGQLNVDQPVVGYKWNPCFSARVSAPSAGSHTYKIQAATSSGTITITAGAANPTVFNPGPAYIMVKAI